MKILISNDDGIAANGIRVLTRALAEDHEVYVIAPDRERSAAGHSLTLHTPLRVEELETISGAKRTWVTTGTPGDCVKIGINAILSKEEMPDLVISGINHGPNLGDDIHFSGTVAGARTAFIFGKPALAVSIDSFHAASPFLIETGNFINHFIRTETIPENVYLNINYPNLPYAEIKGVKYTNLSKRIYKDRYVKSETDDPDQFGMKLYGIIETENSPWNDSYALEKSYISITPMTIDSTDYDFLKKVQSR